MQKNGSAELKKLADTLHSKLDQVMNNDIEQMKTRLLTITDFIYGQIFEQDENPFLPSILDCMTINECERMIKDIREDLDNHINDMIGKCELGALEEIREKISLLNLL